MKILLGYSIPEGKPVLMELTHTVVASLTQYGKTTTLEGIISRSGSRAVAFKTKRGEAGFKNYHEIPAYFVAGSGWQYVESLVNSTLNEKVKYEVGMRNAIMQVSRGWRGDLRQLWNNSSKLAETERSGFKKDVFSRLSEYLELVVPEIEKHSFSQSVVIRDGINVMDLTGMRRETQSLVIASVIDLASRDWSNVVIIIPEAWEHIPQGRNTPVKLVAAGYIRKGAAVGNYLFLDSMPDYEVLFVRRNGLVEATTMESLFQSADVAFTKETGEQIKHFSTMTQVLVPSRSRMIWKNIRHMVRHSYDGPLLRINTKGGILDVSPNHPVMKYPKYLVEAQTLKVDDRLCMRDFRQGGHHNNDVQLFIGTQDLAWFYGFFAAEGWLNRGHVCLSNKNRNLLETAKTIIRDNFNLSASFSTPRRDVYTLEVASPRLEQFLAESCYVRDAKPSAYSKIVPTSILNAPLPIKEAFLKGYVDGDGHSVDGFLTSLVSASRALMLGLTWILHSVMEGSTYTVHIRQDKPKIVQFSINKGKHTKCYGDEVKKIEKVPYKGYLYDLEVDSDDHTFYLGIGNTRVHNSQDIAGIDKEPLRQCDNWLLGHQKDAREVKRTLEEIPKSKRPDAEEIMTLTRGVFYAVLRNDVHKVFVQPSWMDSETAVKVARGELSVDDVGKPVESDEVNREEAEKLRNDNRDLVIVNNEQTKLIENMEGKIQELKKIEEKYGTQGLTVLTLDQENSSLKKRLQEADKGTALVQAIKDVVGLMKWEAAASGSLEVGLKTDGLVVNVEPSVRSIVIDAEKEWSGKVLQVMLEDFKNQVDGVGASAISQALTERGWVKSTGDLSMNVLPKMVDDGLLIKEGKTSSVRYRLPSKVEVKLGK